MKSAVPIALAILATPVLSHEVRSQEVQGPFADNVYGNRIEVKLVEGSGAILADGKLTSRKGRDLTATAKLFAQAKAERLIQLPLATLDRWYAETRGGDGPKPDHLGLFFRLTTKDAKSANKLLAQLKALPNVQEAYLELIPELPCMPHGGGDIAPPTPLWDNNQGYAGAPPNGVNARASHWILGARGRGIKVTDMEVYWTGEHEDLLAMDANDVWLGNKWIRSSGHHGTAVVGEIAADRNGYGVRGLADKSKVHVSSWNNGGVATAISRGVNISGKGDCVLLEVHFRTSVGYLPAEAITSNYNVILTATKKGVNICEAAGNGNVNLNTVAYGGRPSGFLDPSSTNFRESGAIMIGATNGSSTARAGFSNYGRRITSNGWGYNVYTTGYGNLFKPNNDLRQYYTRSFSGTSSASPIVTSVVADLVGAVKFQDEKTLTIQQVRDLLRKYGTPCTGSIGKRPDLIKMLKDQGLPDGLAQSKEVYALGEDFEIDMTSGNGGQMALFVADKLKPIQLGFNRRFHLDLSAMVHVANFALPGKFKVKIPNNPALKTKEFYLQGISVDKSARTHVTSSTQAYIK